MGFSEGFFLGGGLVFLNFDLCKVYAKTFH